MFTCPLCKQEAKTLTIPLGGKLGCRSCNVKAPKVFNVNLGQTVDTYVKKDGSKGRITVGKDWEMSNRRISSEDKRIVINKATGRETQY